MTDDEQAERDVLRRTTEDGMFAIPLGMDIGMKNQRALERLQRRRWVNLIDVSPVGSSGDPDVLFRIFMASEEAMTWFRRTG